MHSAATEAPPQSRWRFAWSGRRRIERGDVAGLAPFLNVVCRNANRIRDTDRLRAMNNIVTLHFPVRSSPVPGQVQAAIHPGCRYDLVLPEPVVADYLNHVTDGDHEQLTGLVGAYRLSVDAAQIEPIDLSTQPPRGFIWDMDLLGPGIRRCLCTDVAPPRSPRNNRLTLMDASLDAPEVCLLDNQPVLTISPRFELEWMTDAFASQLGLVQLVEASRTVQFADGESLVLLDTESAGRDPVLYLNDPDDNAVVKPVCAFQALGGKQRFDFSRAVSQAISAEFNNKPVVSVSVLEKYTWYFMQNAAPSDPDRHIWVPVHLPIVWGWSIRVQQRFDGVWDIFRKKLIMPTPSTEAPALPRWQSNSLRCRTAREG